jgi:hypothetical protein
MIKTKLSMESFKAWPDNRMIEFTPIEFHLNFADKNILTFLKVIPCLNLGEYFRECLVRANFSKQFQTQV